MKVLFCLQEGLDRANQKAISNAQKVQKWIVLGQDFSVPGGELGPTMKMKRHFVLQKYLDNVEMFYNWRKIELKMMKTWSRFYFLYKWSSLASPSAPWILALMAKCQAPLSPQGSHPPRFSQLKCCIRVSATWTKIRSADINPVSWKDCWLFFQCLIVPTWPPSCPAHYKAACFYLSRYPFNEPFELTLAGSIVVKTTIASQVTLKASRIIVLP